MRHLLIVAMASGLGIPATAEVVTATANGFELRYGADLSIPPAEAFDRFASVGKWWSGAHSYSGDPANLSLSLVPGGCFCERFPAGGGIEHLRVTMVEPGKRAVLTGALGPLLFEGATGVMDVTAAPAGAGSRLSVTYRVTGLANGAKLAPVVDRVLGEQVQRLAAFANGTPKP